ncbi:hypothetical protein ACJRO7_002062 [Eucalyptus globulus]|uniref:Uncharacterized protein n=1 Tax=Eucalyptus globulus TaxID=34317 RepID=A0ABD3LT47_EUCGL
MHPPAATEEASGTSATAPASAAAGTSIPSGLRALGVKFKWISDADAVAAGEECRLAFLADKEWLSFNDSKDPRVTREMEFVPGVLEWGIRNRWRVGSD